MQIELPNKITQACLDSGIIQEWWSIKTAESRGSHVQRLTYNVWEFVVSKVNKIFNETKRIK